MNKICKSLVGGLAAVTLVTAISATPSIADISKFPGLSFGVVGSSAKATTKGQEREGTNSSTIEINEHSVTRSFETGAVFLEFTGGTEGGGVAYTVGVEWAPGAAVIGTESRTDVADAQGGTAYNDTGTSTGKAEVENYATLYIEPGYMFNNNFGIYTKIGVSHVDVNSLENLHTSSTYGNTDAWGGVLGAGLKVQSNYGLFVKLSYEFTEFQAVDLEAAGQGNNVHAKPKIEAGRLALGFNF